MAELEPEAGSREALGLVEAADAELGGLLLLGGTGGEGEALGVGLLVGVGDWEAVPDAVGPELPEPVGVREGVRVALRVAGAVREAESVRE